MSEAKEQNNKRSDGEGSRPTHFFKSSMLGPGSQIGPFRIERELGRGAMGIVYLAHDTKLDRSVAIKSLPVEVINNPMVLKRWKREAQLLASLNHPNIAAIYDEFEEAEGVGYLILEYIPGRTLAERISKGSLKLEDALTTALQIAEAVAAAHEQDVIHRDLKPGNIKITPEGKVKVLDFGLAKTVGDDSSEKKSTATEPGSILGTPAYMSPEQARGKPADKRSDIWSFGCILYELLTGNVLFEGETISDTLANVLQVEPDWQALPQGTPANIQVLLRRCLQKDARHRLHDIADAAIEIHETLNLSPATSSLTTPSISVAPHIAVKAKPRILTMAIGVVVIVGIAVWLFNRKSAIPLSKEPRLVVLPFENLGPDEDEYFAAGITDSITAHLASIHGLGVISRQSAAQYKKGEATVQKIATELNVDYILEGTIQRERPSDPNSRVRIIPQLIKASDDTHVWANQYDDDMSEVFQLQSDIAGKVAHALNITLVESERQVLGSRPTENMDAYEFFLRGKDFLRRDYSNLLVALNMFEQAVALDPNFALAWAALSSCYVEVYWNYWSFPAQHNPETLKMAKDAVDKALELEPDLPEAHLALGMYYYHGYLDYDSAMDEFEIAKKKLPNDTDLLVSIGFVQRRQGKFEDALINIKKAYEFDPLSNSKILELGETYMRMRNYPEAVIYFEKAIYFDPDWINPYIDMISTYLLWEGKTDNAHMVLNKALNRSVDALMNPKGIGVWINLDVYDGNYENALERSRPIDTMYEFIPVTLIRARIYRLTSNNNEAEKYYKDARDNLIDRINRDPNDARFYSALGIAYAGLGRRDDAMREGQKGIDLLPISLDALRGYSRLKDLALIYTMVGEYDKAIDEIEFLLSKPGDLSIPLLRLDPDWKPLRDHPRFKKLLEGK